MNEKNIYDISEISSLFGTTPRTLRFYEQKGIIESTRTDSTKRRFYTSTQADHIQKVLILRKLGLSVKGIQELLRQNTDLRSALLQKKSRNRCDDRKPAARSQFSQPGTCDATRKQEYLHGIL